MEITLETSSYLGGAGTQSQQELFQEAADRIEQVYRERYPDDLEDLAVMTADQLTGAAMYALGDARLEDLAATYRRAQVRLEAALDALTGAMITAEVDGMALTEITRRTGLNRGTVYKKLGR